VLFVVQGLLVTTATAVARGKKSMKRIGVSTTVERRELTKPAKPNRKSRGQSIGAPWSGRLESSTKCRAPDRTHVRRPHRAFATRTTVDHTRRAILETLESFPKTHTLAIGDFSAPLGGWISEHN
jgi:hypothetical protein